MKYRSKPALVAPGDAAGDCDVLGRSSSAGRALPHTHPIVVVARRRRCACAPRAVAARPLPRPMRPLSCTHPPCRVITCVRATHVCGEAGIMCLRGCRRLTDSLALPPRQQATHATVGSRRPAVHPCGVFMSPRVGVEREVEIPPPNLHLSLAASLAGQRLPARVSAPRRIRGRHHGLSIAL